MASILLRLGGAEIQSLRRLVIGCGRKGQQVSEEQFTNISMIVCLGGLIIFMGFIIWDLGKKAQAGKMGMFILFLVLGFGVSGFLFKNVLVEFLIQK